MVELKNKRIFIIEDNLNNRAIMQLLLERQGAVVGFERWGNETLQRLKAFEPVDIILLDLMFPNNITGYDVFDQIRSEPGYNHVPVVAVSASDPSEAIPKTREKGFAGFISKPIRNNVFVSQISSVLEGNQIWQTR